MFNGNCSIGLDIGQHTVKFAAADPHAKSIHFLFQEELIHDRKSHDEALRGGDFQKRLHEILQSFRKRYGHSYRNVITSVQGPRTMCSYMELPQLHAEDLELAVATQAVRYIPFPLETVTISHVPVPPLKDGESKSGVFFVAAQKDFVTSVKSVLEDCDLEVSRIEIPAVAMAREFSKNHAIPKEKFVMLVSLGFQFTQVVVVHEGSPYYARYFPLGGRDFTYGFQMAKGLTWPQAEQYKLEYDILSRDAAIEPFLSNCVNEIRRSIHYFNTEFVPDGPGVSSVFLSGGSASIKGLNLYLSTELDLPVEIDYWDRVKPIKGMKGAEPAAPFKIAAGLALEA